MYRDIILSKIKEFCRLKNIECHATKVITLHCVFCDRPGKTAQVMPNSPTIYCHHCINDETRKYNIIDIARKVENKPEATDEEILTLIKNELKLDVHTAGDDEDVMNYLAKFEARGWCLVPCARNDKYPVQQEWQKKQNRDKSEWFHWYKSGLNLGVRTGESSNLCVIDLDFLTKDEKVEWAKETTTSKRRQQIESKKVIPAEIKAVMGDPLIQETLGGFHLCYQACNLPKGVVVIAGIHIDIETEGGQVIVYPSPKTAIYEDYKVNPEDKDVKKKIVGYAKRRWVNDVPITRIPQAFYDLLQKSHPKSAVIAEDPVDGEIQQAIKDENVKVKDFVNNRNNTLIKFGGILRKSMNILEVKKAVTVFNNMVFPDPLSKFELDRIVESLDKYIDDNEAIISNAIVDYLKAEDIASKTDIELAVFGKRATGEEKLRLGKALINLTLKRTIMKQGFRNYKIVAQMKKQQDFLKVGIPIDFKMPYFHDYAYFNKGDLILVGAKTKIGKTTLALNFVKRLVDQKIQPIYLYNESGGRFGKAALSLGLKPGDFDFVRAVNPEEIILEPNKVYIYDWIRVSDFARTADVFDGIVQKLEENNSTMIGFTQLRDGSQRGGNQNEWFAKDLIRQFVSLSAKYLYTDEEGINNKFELGDIRDRKGVGRGFIIPCRYNDETREVKMQEEIEEEERLEQARKDARNDKTKQGDPDNQDGIGQGPNNQTIIPG